MGGGLRQVRPWLRDALAEVLWRTGVSRPHRRHAHRLVIVTFHRVLPPRLGHRYPFPGLWVSPDELRWCLAYFQRHYACAPLRDAHALAAEPRPDSRPTLAVTFDDATLDNHDEALPVLHEAGVHATFFVPVDAVSTGVPLWHDRVGFSLRAAGRDDAGTVVEALKALPPAERRRRVDQLATDPSAVPGWAGMMGLEQVRALADAGHEVGSHSMSHPLLPQCTADQKHHELHTSKRTLEREIDRTVTSIAYPNGDVDADTLEVTAAAGYTLGVTTRFGTNLPTTPPLALHRCDMDARRLRRATGPLSAPHLAWRMSGLHPGLR
jgi:peptidoglycan/xylan/chitin deacetylase (PgdA/CDA1 family)